MSSGEVMCKVFMAETHLYSSASIRLSIKQRAAMLETESSVSSRYSDLAKLSEESLY